MFTLDFDDSEFNRALTEVANGSRRIDVNVLTDQARKLLRKLAWLTRKAPRTVLKNGRRRKTLSGRARAGWWPAWKALKMRGTPYVGNANLKRNTEGSFRDGRQQMGQPFFEMTNEVAYIDKLNDEDDILNKSLEERTRDLENVLDNQYAKMLARKSA